MPILPAVTYREATTDDIPALAQLRWEMEAERGKEAPDLAEYIQAYIASAQDEMNGRRQRAWLAEIAGEPVACALLVWWVLPPNFESHNRRRGFVSSVFTRPAYRRQGIARELMQLLIASAREEGVSRLILWSSEMGRSLYEQLGFVGSQGLELNL